MLDMFAIRNYFDLTKTMAAPLFDDITYPWEVLPRLESFIKVLGPMLSADEFDNVSENVWIHKTAEVAPTASITGPCIVDAGAKIRHCAFIRGNAIIGKGAVVGNSVEVKNSLLFDEVEAPHFNYVGDSVLGYKSHLGAGVITSNIKNDKRDVVIHFPLGEIETHMRKLGAIVGDYSQIGCNSVLNPGSVISRYVNVYPNNSIRGWLDEKAIYKKDGHITIGV